MLEVRVGSPLTAYLCSFLCYARGTVSEEFFIRITYLFALLTVILLKLISNIKDYLSLESKYTFSLGNVYFFLFVYIISDQKTIMHQKHKKQLQTGSKSSKIQ